MQHHVNKNIVHNGKAYEKGSKIAQDDQNFAIFKQAGHLSESAGHVEQKSEAPVVQEEKSEQPAKPVGKSKK